MFLFKRNNPHDLPESAEKSNPGRSVIRKNRSDIDSKATYGSTSGTGWDRADIFTSAGTFESFNFKNSQTKTLSHFKFSQDT